MNRLIPALFLLLIPVVISPAFEAVAYIPHYRIDPLPGAENLLGRPGWDASANAWDGRIVSDAGLALPGRWDEVSSSLKLIQNYDSYLLHISMTEAFGDVEITDRSYFAYMRSLKALSPGAKVRLSLLGHSSDYLPIATDEESRNNFAAYLTELCREEGLDGIDLDWEFDAAPRVDEREAITNLARSIQAALPDEAILSAAVSRWRLPGKEFFAELDSVNLMAYDGYGKHSTYEGAIADAKIVLARMEIPDEKLILGIPFYGRIFDSDSDDYFIGTKNYRDIVREYNPPEDSDEAGGYFFNGPATVRAKTIWAYENRLGGVFVWEPFYDMPGSKSLSATIRAIADQADHEPED